MGPETGQAVSTPPKPDKAAETATVKSFRQQLDATLQQMKAGGSTRERALAITKVQEAIMWLGMDLKRINDGVSCYPGSYDPKDPTIHAPADGLKM